MTIEATRAVAEPQTVRQRMSDGVDLVATVWRPIEPGSHPVLLMRQPYGRRIASTIVLGHPAWYAAQGYIVVVQDVRGTGESGGTLRVFEHEAADGAEAVTWAAGLPGSTGQVGMYGFSYHGTAQLLALSRAPEGLAAVAPAMAGWTIRTDWAYENGAYRLAMGAGWACQLGALEAQRRGDSAAYAALRAAAAAPDFAGPVPAQPALLDKLGATHPHREWIANPDDGPMWQAAPAVQLAGKAPDIPILHIGGWYDLMLTGTLGAFASLPAATQNLLVGPWTHLPWSSLVGSVDFGPQASSVVDRALVSFFDRHLKGRVEEAAPAPVRLFDLGARSWTEQATWPVGREYALFLASDGLAAVRPEDGRLDEAVSRTACDRIVHDPWQPVPALGGHAAQLTGVRDRAAIDARSDVLTFTSVLLPASLKIAGDLAAELYVESDAADFDVDVVLSAIDHDGRVLNLAQGYSRVGAGAAWPLRVPLRATMMTVPAGARLRVSVAGSCFPAFAVNPGTGVAATSATASDARTITIALHSGPRTPSRLVLRINDIGSSQVI